MGLTIFHKIFPDVRKYMEIVYDILWVPQNISMDLNNVWYFLVHNSTPWPNKSLVLAIWHASKKKDIGITLWPGSRACFSSRLRCKTAKRDTPTQWSKGRRKHGILWSSHHKSTRMVPLQVYLYAMILQLFGDWNLMLKIFYSLSPFMKYPSLKKMCDGEPPLVLWIHFDSLQNENSYNEYGINILCKALPHCFAFSFFFPCWTITPTCI